jgi:hypothetical protein
MWCVLSMIFRSAMMHSIKAAALMVSTGGSTRKAALVAWPRTFEQRKGAF